MVSLVEVRVGNQNYQSKIANVRGAIHPRVVIEEVEIEEVRQALVLMIKSDSFNISSN